jgi:hypothetical protein
VQIFGKVPDEIEIEAADEDQAIELALEKVIEELDFTPQLTEEGPALWDPLK